ncbi:V-type ATP synthase subunit E [Oceanivirga salmonicida]|uniref:V-type ATP synthase subunit E n=1 Tax=Oceanivirga salmonicida TaxID=1769291 RepID=UPI0012E207A2|nr:V-type ATP synthase subunit E [Oceanivirga salmonicida]
MNNLERIVAKILEDANNSANSLLEKANNDAKQILEKSEQKLKKEIQNLENEYEIKLKNSLERIKSSTALKARNIILEGNGDAIDIVFKKLDEEIKNISKEDMKKYILKTLENRKVSENEYIVIPKAYEGMSLDGFNIKVSDKINTGFLIEKNGIFENYTLETIIKYNREDIEKFIQSKILN